jgi:hypothetical protein
MLTLIGLGLIVVAWIYQLVSVVTGNKNIRLGFVGGYALGVLILVADGFVAGLTAIASLNLASLVVALLAGVFLIRKK